MFLHAVMFSFSGLACKFCSKGEREKWSKWPVTEQVGILSWMQKTPSKPLQGNQAGSCTWILHIPSNSRLSPAQEWLFLAKEKVLKTAIKHWNKFQNFRIFAQNEINLF